MEKENSISTLPSTSYNLDKDEGEKAVQQSKYRGRIASLLYLTTSYYDIMFVMYMCASF